MSEAAERAREVLSWPAGPIFHANAIQALKDLLTENENLCVEVERLRTQEEEFGIFLQSYTKRLGEVRNAT